MTSRMDRIPAISHPILMDMEDQSIMIEGFSGQLAGEVLLFRCLGQNYLGYGITDGSILLCTNGIKPRDGDLVIKFDGGTPVVYIFRPASDKTAEGTMRVLENADEVDGVIISSFNFYR